MKKRRNQHCQLSTPRTAYILTQKRAQSESEVVPGVDSLPDSIHWHEGSILHT